VNPSTSLKNVSVSIQSCSNALLIFFFHDWTTAMKGIRNLCKCRPSWVSSTKRSICDEYKQDHHSVWSIKDPVFIELLISQISKWMTMDKTKEMKLTLKHPLLYFHILQDPCCGIEWMWGNSDLQNSISSIWRYGWQPRRRIGWIQTNWGREIGRESSKSIGVQIRNDLNAAVFIFRFV